MMIIKAVKLLHKREQEQWDKAFDFINNGTDFENTNFDKIWTWACKRWKNFPSVECEIRMQNNK